MSPPNRDRDPSLADPGDELARDPALSRLREDDPALGPLFEALADELTPLPPPPGARARILAAATPEGRFYRFASRLAELLDVPLAAARALLDTFETRPDWEDGPLPGCSRTLQVVGGPATSGCFRGFLRVDPGVTIPDHRHLGGEQTLVLQGRCDDLTVGNATGPGDLVSMPADSHHSLRVTPGAPPLLCVVVVRDGVEIDGVTLWRCDR